MKPMLSSTKRKESPNPLLSTLTQSKSQIYSHLNRSGRHRRDAFALKPSLRHPGVTTDVSYPSRRRLNSSFPTAGDDASQVTVSPICIKDLRSRRVFSEPLDISEQEEKNSMLSGRIIQQLGCEVKPNSKFTEMLNGYSIDSFGEELKSSRPDGEGEKADVGVNCVEGSVCVVNPCLSRSTWACSQEKDAEIEGFGRGEERLGFLKVDPSCNGRGLDYFSPVTSNPDQIIVEKNVQTTPPDPDIFSLQKEDQNGGTGKHLNASPNTKIDSTPRTKLVLNPCRLKLFKTPNSFSYRRLLPYLQDIAKENSSTIESNTCPNSEVVLEGNPTIQSQVPLKPILRTVSEDDFMEEKLPSDMQAGNSTDQIPSQPNSKDFSDTTRAYGFNTDRKNGRQADLVLSAKGLKVFKSPSSVSYRRLLPFLKAAARNKSCELEIKSCPKLEPVSEENPIVQSQEMLIEDGSSQKFPCSMQTGDSNKIYNNPTTIDYAAKNMLPTSATNSPNEIPSSSITPQVEVPLADQLFPAKYGESTTGASPNLVSDLTVCISDPNAKVPQSCNDINETTMNALEGAIAVYQSTSPSKDLPCSESCPVISSAKGILKRNPGGCRGLCTCLSCSSFRLHAERAFEFSRNQLQDTEDIVMGLVKKLSQVRAALELSFDHSNNGQGSCKTDKFVEICSSASKAEETAITRLKEMNEELFFHCRMKSLQRPRVNFAIDDRRQVEEGSQCRK